MNIILENYDAEKFAQLQKIAQEMGMKLATQEQIEEEISKKRQLEWKKQGKTRWDIVKENQGCIVINDLEAVLQ